MSIGAVESALAAVPRVRLGHAPTPIDDAPRLGAWLGVELHVKRDDCTGLAFGGNKVRQLEFYMGEAVCAGADSVLITGAVQSNFMRTAAAAARQLGMQPHLQLEQRVADPDERYLRSGNVYLDRLLGAELYPFDRGEDEAAADAELERIAARLARAGRRPYVIHLGIEHPPIGGLGYVAAACELASQCRERRLALDAVVVASGSALTHAGLLVGLRAIGDAVPVHGVCVRRGAGPQRERVLRRAREIAALLGRAGLVGERDVHVTDAVLAPGYGKMNDATWQAMSAAARLEALFVDPVYTGKTLAGLVHLVGEGVIAAGSRVLFVHTGGQPALFGYEQVLDGWLRREPPPAPAGGP